jgi:hypothetical protein
MAGYLAFQLSEGISMHVSGLPACRGCLVPPVPCSVDGCQGLVHSERSFDSNESGVKGWVEAVCDQCGELAFTYPTTLEQAQSSWDSREKKYREDAEKRRLEANPTAAEIVAAWVQAVAGSSAYDPNGRGRVYSKMREDGSVSEEVDPHGLPDIKAIKCPTNAAGSLNELFFSKQRARLFAAFMDELNANPNDNAVRAAALGCYWRLANHTLDLTDDPSDPIRRLFASILSIVVNCKAVAQTKSWVEARWEIRNAYAASDWERVREIFEFVKRRKLLPYSELAGIRMQFESLLLIGPHLDALSATGRGPLGSVESKIRWAYSLNGHSFAQQRLRMDPILFSWTDDRRRPQRFFVVLPLLDQPLPVLAASDIWHMKVVLKEGLSDIESFPDKGLVQRAIAAYMYEAMDARSLAAEHYQVLGTVYGEMISEEIAQEFRFKAAEMYQRAGNMAKARSLTEELFSAENAETMRLKTRLARLAFDLGLVEKARALLREISPEQKETLDVYLKLLIDPANDDLLRNLAAVQARVAKKLSEWPSFSRLSSAAQDSWRCALIHQQSSESVGEVKRSWERAAVNDYALTIEIELRQVFVAFRTSELESVSRLQVSLASDDPLKKFLDGGTIALGVMIKALDGGKSGKIRSEANTLLLNYVGKKYPALLSADIIALLQQIRPARNEGTHEGTTRMSPEKAEGVARRIVEAIHLH